MQEDASTSLDIRQVVFQSLQDMLKGVTWLEQQGWKMLVQEPLPTGTYRVLFGLPSGEHHPSDHE